MTSGYHLAQVFLTFEEVHAHERPPLKLDTRSEMVHFLVTTLDLFQVRRVCALHQPERTHTVTLPVSHQKVTGSHLYSLL